MGVVLLIASIIPMIVVGGDVTYAVITIPLALLFIFTKEMIVADDYYFEVKARENEEEL
jgi:hypothetical protein